MGEYRLDVRLENPGLWTRVDGVAARGRAFLDGRLLDAHAIAELFSGQGSADQVIDLARSLTGHYAVLSDAEALPYAIVDSARSFPLFFNETPSALVVSDTPYATLQAGESAAPREDSLVDFAYCGYVSGARTLVGEVKQVPAGTILLVGGGENRARGAKLVPFDVFVPSIEGDPGKSDSELHALMRESMSAAVDRLITIAGGRTIALALSGGYDSRLLAMLLKEKGYDAVLCFCYGKDGNSESVISRPVAEELGFPWEFIRFDESTWASWVRSSEWQEYVQMAHLGVSLPLVQAWGGVLGLRSAGVLPDDAVFVPGMLGGGCLAGKYSRRDLLDHAPGDRLRAAHAIVNDLYNLWWDEPARSLHLESAPMRIADDLAVPGLGEWEADCSAYEYWRFSQYNLGFLANDSRVYEYWGYDWWMPFADKAHVSIWQHVPYARRIGMGLYADFVTDYMPDALGVRDDSVLRLKRGSGSADLIEAKTIASVLRRFARNLDRGGHARAIRDRLRGPQAKLDNAYYSHPLGWWGVVDKSQFDRQFTGAESIYSFMTQQMLADRYGWSRERVAE